MTDSTRCFSKPTRASRCTAAATAGSLLGESCFTGKIWVSAVTAETVALVCKANDRASDTAFESASQPCRLPKKSRIKVRQCDDDSVNAEDIRNPISVKDKSSWNQYLDCVNSNMYPRLHFRSKGIFVPIDRSPEFSHCCTNG